MTLKGVLNMRENCRHGRRHEGCKEEGRGHRCRNGENRSHHMECNGGGKGNGKHCRSEGHEECRRKNGEKGQCSHGIENIQE